MKVLVACEVSGRVRDEFLHLGANAYSCDIEPAYVNGVWTRSHPRHIQCDVREILDDNWDLMIAHPPCRYLCSSGMQYSKYKVDEQLAALDFVRTLLQARVPRIALENPRGIISTHIEPPTQRIHPWMFGDPYSKETCLWLKNLPVLHPTTLTRPEIRPFYPPRTNRSLLRSITFPGIAKAMAQQWYALPALPRTL